MKVAFVLKGYPRLSETFIAQEIEGLEQRGLDIHLFSLRHPTDTFQHPVHGRIKAPVSYLPEYLHHEPVRVFKSLCAAIIACGFWRSLAAFIKDFRKNLSRSRIRRFGQALVLAHELPKDIQHIHAHFLHTPASVVYYAALMKGLKWTVSAHAKDIWTSPTWELQTKLSHMAWLVTCTKYGAEHLKSISPDPTKVHLSYHGLDFGNFPPKSPELSSHDGSNNEQTVRLITVGRLVPKKGYTYLLQALSQLPQDCFWHLTHIGGGDLKDKLQNQAQQLGINDKISWLGAQPQKVVLDHYKTHDLFILPSCIDADGDRDGLPNVLMEAQSQGITCLSTTISAIPELITHNETGYLVEQKNTNALTDALNTLIPNPSLRLALAQAAQENLLNNFNSQHELDTLYKRFTNTD